MRILLATFGGHATTDDVPSAPFSVCVKCSGAQVLFRVAVHASSASSRGGSATHASESSGSGWTRKRAIAASQMRKGR